MMIFWYCGIYGGEVGRCLRQNIRKLLIWEQVWVSKEGSLATGFYYARSDEVIHRGFAVLEGFVNIFAVPYTIKNVIFRHRSQAR